MPLTALYPLPTQIPMTAIIASKSSPPQGSRPINVRRDLNEIVELLELVFYKELPKGQRRKAKPSFGKRGIWPFNGWQASIPGFVWVQDQKIVGNVSLLNTQTNGRYLIANVAVHPSYRRRGIARHLMEDTLHWLEQHKANVTLLQVEEDNHGAIRLYESLGFYVVDTAQSWEMPYNHLRPIHVPPFSKKPDQFDGFELRPWRGQRWQEAYALDTAVFPPDLNWPDPLPPEIYKRGLSRWWRNFTNGTQEEVWTAISTNNQLIALGAILNEWAQPYTLKIRVHPHWQGLIERPLFGKLIRRLTYMRPRTIRIEHLSSDPPMFNLIREAGMRPHRILTTMRLNLQ